MPLVPVRKPSVNLRRSAKTAPQEEPQPADLFAQVSVWLVRGAQLTAELEDKAEDIREELERDGSPIAGRFDPELFQAIYVSLSFASTAFCNVLVNKSPVSHLGDPLEGSGKFQG